MDIKDADAVNNRYNSEMAKDGLYSLFSAFLKNELDYRAYYRTLPDAEAAAFLAREFTADDTSGAGGFVRQRKEAGASFRGAIRPNVVVVVMESMGAEFLNECREDGADVTPCLSRLGKEGIFSRILMPRAPVPYAGWKQSAHPCRRFPACPSFARKEMSICRP